MITWLFAVMNYTCEICKTNIKIGQIFGYDFQGQKHYCEQCKRELDKQLDEWLKKKDN